MPEQNLLRRPVLLASAGLVTATIIYCAFVAYTQKPGEHGQLHRSNAVRRSRRRWRRGHAPRDLPNDPMTEALRHLHSRHVAGQPYGRYENRLLFDITQESLDQGRYDLSITNIGPMIQELQEARPFTDFEKELLARHVESMFLQNFLVEEFPAGYIIGDDVESLVHAMSSHGIGEEITHIMVNRFDAGKPLTPTNWDLHEEIRLTNDAPPTTISYNDVTPRGAIEALTGPVDVDDSDSGWGIDDDESDPGGSQGMLDLLYHIAGEQARRDGLIHREVRCNSCGTVPIRGIRYHCANCFDYDLCETCEAQQVHHKNHVFYKIRIPAPSRGPIKQVVPAWYPGDPNAFPISLPKELSKQLMEAHKMEKMELDSLYEQYKCLAGHHVPRESDPTRLGMAIDRKNFDFYFTSTSDDRSPPQNLIYDRVFAFYDVNNDDLITFDEFVRGLSNLQNRTRAARAKRMFEGYDLDGDGYVSRRDFLRMLRAYYAWHKELNRELILNQDELDEDIRDAIHGAQPISAAFGWNEFAAHVSRGEHDKTINANGDLDITSGPNGVLQHDSNVRGNPARAIASVAVRGQTRLNGARSFQPEEPTDEPVFYLPFSGILDYIGNIRPGDATEEDLLSADPTNHIYGWPPEDMPESVDIINGIGADIPVDEIMDPTDRARVIYSQSQRMQAQSSSLLFDARRYAVHDRWRRRQFYLDEEEGLSRPPGYAEPDSSDEEQISDGEKEDDEDQSSNHNANSRRQSMRSRSSSKVRFDDSAIDTDHETRSNASSRSIPTNERWGGYDLSEAEKDIGKEILYQTVQQGFNELLDPLFKQKEEQALVAIGTKKQRTKWRSVLDAYQERLSRAAKDGEENPATVDVEKLNTEPGKSVVVEDNAGTSSSTKNTSDSTGVVANGNVPIPAFDTTLPHLRPNDRPTADLLAESRDANGAGDAAPTEIEASPSDTVLAVWIGHDAIEQEAIVRGGYGRLSFREFQQRMVTESINDVLKVLDMDSDDENEIWSSTADLGRLSFLGSWLEMARF